MAPIIHDTVCVKHSEVSSVVAIVLINCIEFTLVAAAIPSLSSPVVIGRLVHGIKIEIGVSCAGIERPVIIYVGMLIRKDLDGDIEVVLAAGHLGKVVDSYFIVCYGIDVSDLNLGGCDVNSACHWVERIEADYSTIDVADSVAAVEGLEGCSRNKGYLNHQL